MSKEELKAYEEQLKPCPFCGGKAEIRYDEIVDMYVVNCDSKTCEVVPITAYFGDPEEAVKVWNKRGDKAE